MPRTHKPTTSANRKNQSSPIKRPTRSDGTYTSDIKTPRDNFSGILDDVTQQCDSLIRKLTSTEKQLKQTETEKLTFQAQVADLKDKIADTVSLHKQLTEALKSRANLSEQLQDMTDHLDVTDTLKDALAANLTGANETLEALRTEVANLRNKLTRSEKQILDLNNKLKDRKIANARLESEMKTRHLNIEAIRNEVDVLKNAFCQIRSEATRTSSRVYRRYFSVKE